jgi:hypothetical protein
MKYWLIAWLRFAAQAVLAVLELDAPRKRYAQKKVLPSYGETDRETATTKLVQELPYSSARTVDFTI